MPKAKYTLVNTGDGPKDCAFFDSEMGCRNGSNCKFIHAGEATEGSLSQLKKAVVAPLGPATATALGPVSASPPAPASAPAPATVPVVDKPITPPASAKKRKGKSKKRGADEVSAAMVEASLPPPTPAAQAGPTPKKRRNKKGQQTVEVAAPASPALQQTDIVYLPQPAPIQFPVKVVSQDPAQTPSLPPVANGGGVHVAIPTDQDNNGRAPQKKANEKVCSFYNKKSGCKSGALCPFLHVGEAGGGNGGTRGRAKPADPQGGPKKSPGPKQKKNTRKARSQTPIRNPAPAPAPAPPAVPKCLFFPTPMGCKNGSACPFVHERTGGSTATPPSALLSAPPSVPPSTSALSPAPKAARVPSPAHAQPPA
ncbi:unnamed protein product, partial [Discosporangium mesarthrocarpum]